ncbi:hypothetical protein LCGC14_0376930 [marine sediment metagenome]|uniref:Uncharacterized protein n=1 Tax=marine sediment metagenome TaxID=412755 RepID=A0A0F9TLP8_9ZZZZ
MIRRTVLKALMASPLGFLSPKPVSATEVCNDALRKLGREEFQLTGMCATTSFSSFYIVPDDDGPMVMLRV